MKLRMPSYCFDEHHEAFYYWGEAIEKGYLKPKGNVLFHVDHHDDFEYGAYFRDFTKPFASLEERKEFTYHKLGIADFIVPALFEGIFDRFYNMKSLVPVPFEEASRVVSLSHGNILNVSEYIAFLHGQFKRDRDPSYSFYTYYEGSLSPTPAMDFLVLDMDLDYFCWDDALTSASPKRIELTRAGYEDFVNDPHHPFRILPRKLLHGVEADGKYYLQYEEPPLHTPIASEERILKRIARFEAWLREQPWEPALVTICRSSTSGYLPRERADLVETEVEKVFTRLYGI